LEVVVVVDAEEVDVVVVVDGSGSDTGGVDAEAMATRQE